jgi:uncharacterized metal-binding protein YceD (DUF177 family)
MTTEVTLMADIPALAKSGQTLHFAAKPKERKVLSARIEVPELLKFEADFTASRQTPGIYLVKGKVQAEMVQTCVRTLEPVKTSINQAFSLTFMAEKDYSDYLQQAEEREIADIEVLCGEEVNLGEIAVQYLSLFVDRFPAAEGAPEEKDLGHKPGFESGDSHIEAASPFAILKKLDKKG